MRLLFTFIVMCSILLISDIDNTFAANLQLGEEIFSSNCAACHAGGNNAIMPEKTLKADILSENNMNSIQAITTQVTSGKNAMPAFGGRLSDDDIDNVANYVLNQSEAGWQ
uniref:Cytochrome c6 n=1 Tax=Plocamium cartilagineum TaxID=31452 RepID=A0A1C9CHX0_PLOCA|nr:cytochrome c553 [Plocamium cartilagineum]AOM67957.1 cytochrome c553 [Plocamium cartilagineum]